MNPKYHEYKQIIKLICDADKRIKVSGVAKRSQELTIEDFLKYRQEIT